MSGAPLTIVGPCTKNCDLLHRRRRWSAELMSARQPSARVQRRRAPTERHSPPGHFLNVKRPRVRVRKLVMPMSHEYEAVEPTRAAIDATRGITVLEFGAPWCGFCRAAQPLIEQVLSSADGLTHLKIEDGSGRPLGRSFRVKLWPTLIFLKDGVEQARVVRPQAINELRDALRRATGS